MIVTDRDAEAKKLIVQAYRMAAQWGVEVWGEDEAGPFQTIPMPGQAWQAEGHPGHHPHAYLRNGTVKLLTLLHPRTGQVRVKGVPSCTNTVLQPGCNRNYRRFWPISRHRSWPPRWHQWTRWQQGLRKKKFTLRAELPPLRVVLILDNLAGHHTPAFIG